MSKSTDQTSWKNVLLGENSDDKSATTEIKVKRKATHSLIAGIVLELLSILAVAVIAGIFRFSDVIPVIQRNTAELVCRNTTRYTYALNNDVFHLSDPAFYCASFLAPIVSIIVFEIIRGISNEKTSKVLVISRSIHIYTPIRRVIRFSSTFFLVACLTALLVDIMKIFIVEPRPYILSAYSHICSTSVTNDDLERSVITSFPSYRATMSAYSATFCIIYIHKILSSTITFSLQPILTSFFLLLSIISCCQRIVTNESHWQDVVIGFIMGVIIACYAGLILLRKFHENPVQVESEPIEPNKILPRVSLRHIPKAYTLDTSERVSYISSDDVEPQFSFLKSYGPAKDNQAYQRPLSR